MQGLRSGVGRVKIICEYTWYGNKCPDVNCILDHTPRKEGLPSANPLIQSDMKGPPSGHSWCFLTQQVPNYKNRRPPVGD